MAAWNDVRYMRLPSSCRAMCVMNDIGACFYKVHIACIHNMYVLNESGWRLA